MTHDLIDRQSVLVQSGDVSLHGDLSVPQGAQGLVIFAHGSGSGRKSRRNRYVADELVQGGLATLLFDLLTEAEEEVDLRTRHLRFDIPLLATRLTGVVDWAAAEDRLKDLRVGLFGASTGAAAALISAADRPDRVDAVVSRGGRPDMAADALPRVQAPTLLIVGGLDGPVIGMNQEAEARLRCDHRLDIVPGASHLFEEPGKLEEVARLAREWLQRHLGGRRA